MYRQLIFTVNTPSRQRSSDYMGFNYMYDAHNIYMRTAEVKHSRAASS